MEFIKTIIDFVLHIDQHLVDIVRDYQTWTYLVLFLIIFAETGLVVTPILPGDSLLFAAGAVVAKPDSGLSIGVLWALISIAAVLGDLVNYHIGKYIGVKAFSGRYKLLKMEYLQRTREFYERYGGKTIIYARFIPIVRTFAPFVAGIGTMTYGKFAMFNVVGGIAWVTSFLFLGYFFGGLPVIKDNFTYVVIGIILVSVMPAVIQVAKERRKSGPAATGK
jgi:membrane-associated protein